VLGTHLPETTNIELRVKLWEIYETSTKKMFSDLKAKTLAINNVMPSTIFAAYGAGEGFFAGDGKKNQFPDAFIFECLKAEATEKTPVLIVSCDGDFVKPIENEANITLVQSLPDLFTKLRLVVEAPEVNEFIESRNAELVDAVDKELENWGLFGDVEDSEIFDTEVTKVTVIGLTTFGSIEEGGAILVVCRLAAKANISYTHPDWDSAIYDSEDKRAYTFRDVSGEAEITFEVDTSMSILVDEEGHPTEIDELRFRNGDFQYVSLSSLGWDQ
jgi:hypothetical protein